MNSRRILVVDDDQMPIRRCVYWYWRALLSYFSAYGWPGNIRELENVSERLVVLASGGDVTVDDLPTALTEQRPSLDMLQMEIPPEGFSWNPWRKSCCCRCWSSSSRIKHTPHNTSG